MKSYMLLRLLLQCSLYCFFAFIFSSNTLAEDTIKVGVIVPLTGPLAEFGVALQNGVQLAQQKEKAALAKLQFIYEDSQYSPQSAISIFRKFSSDPAIKFIINFGCPTSQAIAPLAEQTKIPTALFCSSLLLTKGKSFAFGMTSPANEWASILWQHLHSKGLKKLCLVLTQNDYLVSEYTALKAETDSHGQGDSLVVLEQYTPQETDFRSSVIKLREKSCDALGVYMLPGQVRTFFDQTRALKLTYPVFGTDIFESIEEITASKGSMEGAVFVNLAVPSSFKQTYVSEYHNENQVAMACVAHDLVVRIGKTIIASGSKISAQELMSKIQQSGEQSGECGKSAFVKSDTGEQFVRFPLVLKHIVNGEIQDVVR